MGLSKAQRYIGRSPLGQLLEFVIHKHVFLLQALSVPENSQKYLKGHVLFNPDPSPSCTDSRTVTFSQHRIKSGMTKLLPGYRGKKVRSLPATFQPCFGCLIAV